MVPQSARRGLGFMLLAVCIFAAQDGISKHLAENYPPFFIVAVRYWTFGLFVLFVAARAPGGIRAAANAGSVTLQMIRGALLALQVVVAITAFAKVGLAETMALFAAAPLLVAALSVPVLKEPVGWRRWSAIGVGCIGVLIILRPGPTMFDGDIWIAMLAVAGIATYGVMTRLVSRTDSATTTFFYTGVGGMVVMTFIGPFYWTSLSLADWGWLAILCCTGATGHFFFIKALESTDAVVIQPVQYVQTMLGAMTGVFLFGEVLEGPVIIGAALVIAAGLFTVWREAIKKKMV